MDEPYPVEGTERGSVDGVIEAPPAGEGRGARPPEWPGMGPPVPQGPPERYACLRCGVVYGHDRMEKGIRCPECQRKLTYIPDKSLTREALETVLGMAILIWANLAVVILEAYVLREPFHMVGVVLFSVLTVAMALIFRRLAKLYKLAWGVSWMDKTRPRRRMVNMSYSTALTRVRTYRPKDEI
jgi:DNA-directed RNA polymerase subunit RPC12/RpoP